MWFFRDLKWWWCVGGGTYSGVVGNRQINPFFSTSKYFLSLTQAEELARVRFFFHNDDIADCLDG